MSKPYTFTLIIPTYNRADLLVKTLQSILAQTCNDYEALIIDDGSTDATEQVVNAFIAQQTCDRFKYFKKENAERGAARNYGAKHAKGKYLNFVDSDDVLINNHLSEALKAINKIDIPEVFHLSYAWVTTELKKIKEVKSKDQFANNKLISGNILSCNGVFIRSDIALENLFNENRNLSASEDWELWLRLAARYKIHLIPKVTSYIVNHDGRSVNQFNETKIIKRRDSLIQSLSEDEFFIRKYPNGLRKINSHMNSYLALHAALHCLKFKSIKYFLISITQDFSTIFNKRTLVIIKYILFR